MEFIYGENKKNLIFARWGENKISQLFCAAASIDPPFPASTKRFVVVVYFRN
jgi:hypothetical protein